MTAHPRIDRQAESAKRATTELRIGAMGQTQWQQCIEANAAAFLAELGTMVKRHIETSNRSFGQRIRHQKDRAMKIRSERAK